MLQTTVLALHGLSCMNCVDHVKIALKNRADVHHAEVNIHYAKVTGTAKINALIDTVKQTGYQAEEAQIPDVELQLLGLSCGRCTETTRKALEAVPDVIAADVTIDSARVFGKVETQSLIAAVEQAGYHATRQGTQSSKSEPLTNSVPYKTETLEASFSTIQSTDNEPIKNSISTPNTPQTNESTNNTITPATQSTADDESIQLLLTGMSCASCVSKIQHALESVDGVQVARVNLAERSALVTGTQNKEALIEAVKNAGYGAEIIEDEGERRERQQQLSQASMKRFQWQAALGLLLGIPLMGWGLFGGNMALTPETQTPWLIVGVLTLLVMTFAGGHFYRNAWISLKNGSATMDTLVALGTGAAWVYSITVNIWPDIFPMEARHLYYEASAMIIGLINLGHAMEQRARQRSSNALERLLDLAPPTASLVTEEGDKVIPLADVQLGMTLRLTTGDRVPVDGEIVQGEVWMDEAMLTGEPIPQQKSAGDVVHAGTQVQDGSVLFRANAIGSQTTLARIIKLVRQAQSSKPEMGKLADRISAIFVPTVVAIAAAAGLIWYFFGPQPHLVYTLVVTTTVLIIACPCALGLATPMSIISGVGRAAELGVLVRDADALQQASELDTLVFDKTGTLTEGHPQVVAIHTFNGVSEQQALSWAAALETGSNHPLARAILQRAEGITPVTADRFRTLRGLGVSGEIEGVTLLLGNNRLLEQQQIDTHALQSLMQQQAASGTTPVILAANGKPAALLSIRDPLRNDSVSALERLHQLGYSLIMLTGDNPITANAIAKEAGIDQVIAGVLPDGKAEAVKQLQAAGHKVAMIGDGINDAPALAQADVGIAMGGGSDIAIETAAITLMRHSLHGVADAVELSKATLRNMKQNLLGAFFYNALGIPIAAGILFPFTGTLLSPVVAGAAMALSSITVVSNANRLLRFKPKQ